MKRLVEVERCSLPGLNLVRRSLMYDGAMLIKALKVRRAILYCNSCRTGSQCSSDNTGGSYDHVLNTAILCGQRNFAHAEVWKFGDHADRREGCYNCQVLMTQMNGLGVQLTRDPNIISTKNNSQIPFFLDSFKLVGLIGSETRMPNNIRISEQGTNVTLIHSDQLRFI